MAYGAANGGSTPSGRASSLQLPVVRVQRRFVVLEADGEATLRTVLLPYAGFGQRCRELRESLPDTGHAGTRTAVLACDGCGARVALDYDRPEFPAGWAERDDGDFCPSCLLT